MTPADDTLGPLVRPPPRAARTRSSTRSSSRACSRATCCTTAAPRLLDTDDPDLRLLAGDYLYALGLSRLARLGDLEAVRELADLITLCAPGTARRGSSDDGDLLGRPCGRSARWRSARAAGPATSRQVPPRARAGAESAELLAEVSAQSLGHGHRA